MTTDTVGQPSRLGSTPQHAALRSDTAADDDPDGAQQDLDVEHDRPVHEVLQVVPELERGVRWDDPQLDIAWPTDTPHLSARDAALPLLSELGPTDLMSVVAAPECG